MINVQVDKGAAENNLSVLRRFTKRVQGSGILSRVRGIRYYERNRSHYVHKKNALTRIAMKEEILTNIKLGKVKPAQTRN
jgi:ribosomal protein S21